MRARKAKPRPTAAREEVNRASTRRRDFGSAPPHVSHSRGAVLPEPGFPCPLSSTEKSGLGALRHERQPRNLFVPAYAGLNLNCHARGLCAGATGSG